MENSKRNIHFDIRASRVKSSDVLFLILLLLIGKQLAFTQLEEKVKKSGLMFGCYLPSVCELFLTDKGLKLCSGTTSTGN